jgi:hypothetical protein
MGTLQLTRIMPNPAGKDSSWGRTTNDKLNQEWVEFVAVGGDRNLTGDKLLHRTYTTSGCILTGADELTTFNGTLKLGQSIRVHTGSGQDYWEGPLFHLHLGRSWFIWNNGCGDQATLTYNGNTVDSASYSPNPPERTLVRVPGTNWFQ